MYEYHGWVSTFTWENEKEIEESLKEINSGYPVSVNIVNGKLHISFSGNPNRNLGQVEKVVSYLCGLKNKVSGCIYVNDSNSEDYNIFYVVKILDDIASKIKDKNFTNEETSALFE